MCGAKTCYKCKKKLPLDAFYVHKRMADGHLNKCITCTREAVLDHRAKNLERIRAYDRRRGGRPTAEYLQSEACKLSSKKSNKKWKLKNPEKRKAMDYVNKAIKYGYMERQSCHLCNNDNTDAHLEDYAQPFMVLWLCKKCHMERHKELNSLKRDFKTGPHGQHCSLQYLLMVYVFISSVVSSVL